MEEFCILLLLGGMGTHALSTEINRISVLVASRPAWVAGLNKRTGCDSPRCRRCKCREGLPLTKVSHWIFSEKADRLLA